MNVNDFLDSVEHVNIIPEKWQKIKSYKMFYLLKDSMSFNDIQEHLKKKMDIFGYKDWRLPTAGELKDIAHCSDVYDISLDRPSWFISKDVRRTRRYGGLVTVYFSPDYVKTNGATDILRQSEKCRVILVR